MPTMPIDAYVFWHSGILRVAHGLFIVISDLGSMTKTQSSKSVRFAAFVLPNVLGAFWERKRFKNIGGMLHRQLLSQVAC